MNLPFVVRLPISLSLFVLVLTVFDPIGISHYFMTDNVRAHLQHTTMTTCEYLVEVQLKLSKGFICSKINLVVFALLTASSFGILIKASKLMLIIVAFNISIWSCLLANIGVDSSFMNWDWALQATVVIAGMVALAFNCEP